MPASVSRRLVLLWLLCLPFLTLVSSCTDKLYNQRVMFQLDKSKGLDTTKIRRVVNRVNRNYTIQINDFLSVRVYTNEGERIIDPNGELRFGAPAGLLPTGGNGSRTLGNSGQGGSSGGMQSAGGSTQSAAGESEFLVQTDGYVRLPLVNRVRVTGLTLLQADSVLQIRYSEFYKGVFVTTRVTNNRVIVLGSPGGRIVPLVNDNMNLLEVLASAGGIDGGGGGGGGTSGLYRSGGKASNIRIIRGDLKNPQIEQVDLTTIDGMRRANLQVEPNDIIYIEPIRRPFYDALNDAAPAIGLSTTLLNIVFLVFTFTR
ncbi:polysaccharide biosynthesis/export family protein [Hymenobacter canadensis]|uniref:Polysaccharide biosynthesis/export family protein n=1 Tax=Hymenobacter canadensis TaxID=2999067 RepID=A0ABY7LMG3_9BACT|nr:polysaccharide biosynthesis/export family protein [Hymenobacter canadensis]WBA40636.1 polysaccharide biosynthesis/export family protein [Hymenobacter canadensis]